MSKLYLQRHLKSQWNLDDRFAGWTDGPLTKDADSLAQEFTKEISQLNIDKIYCSAQFRSMDTIARILEYIPEKYPLFIHLDRGRTKKWGNYVNGHGKDTPVYVSEKLNERYYGRLQGLNKKETAEKYGEEQVHLWRRSYNVAPPGGESLRDVYNRVIPFHRKNIEKDLKAGKNVLVVASHNSLRAIVKYVENIQDDKIAEVELPFGSFIKYDFSENKYTKL